MIDDLQWKGARTTGINERFWSCCVGQDDLYTSMLRRAKANHSHYHGIVDKESAHALEDGILRGL